VYLTWTTLSFSGWHTLELIEETILSKARPEGHQSEVIRLRAATNSVDFDISLYDVKRTPKRRALSRPIGRLNTQQCLAIQSCRFV
jgi:hypothetical protein